MGENQCGNCGGDITSVDTWMCPTCGKDFREVGILPKRPGEQWLVKLNEHRRVHGWRPVKEALCGQCAYPIHGRENFDCPECGGDVRAVGIKVPGQMKRILFPARQTLGCLLLALGLPALLIGVILTTWIPGLPEVLIVAFIILWPITFIWYIARSWRDGIRQSMGEDKQKD